MRAWCERVIAVPSPPVASVSLRDQLQTVPAHFALSFSAPMRQHVIEGLAGSDAVVALQARAAFHVAPLARRVPAVFDEVEVGLYHEMERQAPSRPAQLRRRLTRWKYERFMRRLTSQFDRATVVSGPERQLLIDAGCRPDLIDVVPNGTAIGPTRNSGVRARRVVYPGAVTYSANLDAVQYFISEIWPAVRRAHPELEFWVTGDTANVDLAPLRADGVRFTGWIPDIERVVAESLACVVPLRLGGGTRLKILQAMALQTPVVTTTKGREGLEGVHGEHFLVADTPGAFAAQLARLLTDTTVADRMAAAARTLVETCCSWETVGDAFDRTLSRAGIAGRQEE